MNGQPSLPPQPPGLVVALIASLAVHGAVIFMPYLGYSAREIPIKVQAPAQPPRMTADIIVAAKKTPHRTQQPPKHERPADTPTSPPPAENAQLPESRREGADVLPTEAPLFYPTEQLTRRPQPIEVSELDTPDIQPILASGRLVLKLWINDLGEVVDVDIEKSDLPEAFAKSAVAAFKRMRFTPGERQGKPVGSVMRIEVSYEDGRKPPQAPEPAPATPNAQP